MITAEQARILTQVGENKKAERIAALIPEHVLGVIERKISMATSRGDYRIFFRLRKGDIQHLYTIQNVLEYKGFNTRLGKKDRGGCYIGITW